MPPSHHAEYSFGHGDSGTGVFDIEPGSAGSGRYREKLHIGNVNMSYAEIQSVIDRLKPEFMANDYHITNKNCNHFSAALLQNLGLRLPGYVNRLAGWGSYCSCLLPPEMQQPEGVPTGSGGTYVDDGSGLR